MKNSRIIITTTLLLFLSVITVQAQTITVSGQLGYASPIGDAFVDPETDEKQSSFGIGYDFDALYEFESISPKLSAGIMYSGAALFGKNSSEALDIGIYGLNLYGVKGQYILNDPDAAVRFYGSLGLGLTQFATPDITITDESGTETIIEGESAFSFGVRPELGVNLGGFLISTSLLVPMKYTVESDTGDFSGTAGTFNISIGYRYVLDF
ncbi:MAG: hypothetical protein AAF193_03460 [Bacteroidota bacterium]